jgi:hypothetical protein
MLSFAVYSVSGSGYPGSCSTPWSTVTHLLSDAALLIYAVHLRNHLWSITSLSRSLAAL